MDFKFEQLRLSHNSDEIIEFATEVKFEDSAEIAFAIACIDAARIYIELSPAEQQEELASTLKSFENSSRVLQSLLEDGIRFTQEMLPVGVISRNSFTSNNTEVANAAFVCAQLVKISPEVLSCFPLDRSDLLALSTPEE